ncbi:putative lipoprotein aminopeptidase LpqL [Mycobacterium xenopi 3993]|nr:putative lipoprotein aminopeptidase LpqL [Mycobacterium xenopi 3993]
MGHLSKLQEIANASNGTRAVAHPVTTQVSTMWRRLCGTMVSTCKPRSLPPEYFTLTRDR